MKEEVNEMDIKASQMTDKELQAIIDACEDELQYRRMLLKEKLIDNFKAAFCALRENGIAVRYSDYEQNAYRTYLDKFDNFDFSD